MFWDKSEDNLLFSLKVSKVTLSCKEKSWLDFIPFGLQVKTSEIAVIFRIISFRIEADTCKIKSRIAMAKAAFNKKKNLFTSKLDLNLRKKLVKCYVSSMALYGAETWTLRATDQKRLESF